MHPGGSDSIGALGYVNAFGQIVQHSQKSGVHFHKIVLSTGSTGTQVGLLLGQTISGYDTTIIGMAASRKSDVQCGLVRDLALPTAQMLGIQFDTSTIVVDDQSLGPGYAIPSREGQEAAKMFATVEVGSFMIGPSPQPARAV